MSDGGSSREKTIALIGAGAVVCLILGAISAFVIGGTIPVFFLGLAVIGLLVFFLFAPKTDKEKAEDEQAKRMATMRKYNNMKYTCPMCGSHKIKNIGTVTKLGGVAAVGLASKNIAKNYQCDSCNYRW